LPLKGTLTAWKEIIKQKVLRANYVYEYDFVSYFDTIDLAYLVGCMESLRIPPIIHQTLLRMNRTAPKLPEEELLDESGNKLKDFSEGGYAWEKGRGPYQRFFDTHAQELNRIIPRDGTTGLREA